eukprot:Nk52_evm1s2241 gene=Nk52_evmTU1s2241
MGTTEVSEPVSVSDLDGGADQSDKPVSSLEDEWLDVVGNGLLLAKTVKPGLGDDNDRPRNGDVVTMGVVEKFEDGSVIHSVSSDETSTFRVGEGDVIMGLDLIAPFMHKGEIMLVKCDARYAYGELGLEPDIPPSTTILLEAELIDFEEKKDVADMTLSERLSTGMAKKERGNNLFNRALYEQAINAYSKGIEFMVFPETFDEDNSEEVEVLENLKDTKVKCMNNLASALVKVKDYKKALQVCEDVLVIDSESVKALFRKGQAHLAINEYDEARAFLKRAVSLEPSNQEIRDEFEKAKLKEFASKKKQKKIYSKMIGSLNGTYLSNDETIEETFLEKHGTIFFSLMAVLVVIIAYFAYIYFQS